MFQPARYGGLETRYGLHTMLAAEVARGCASSGWALSITACHSWIFGMFPRQAQDEFWSPDPQRTLVNADLYAAVARAVLDLPERQREAILLCHYQECGNIEASEILGVSVEALESLLARGRRALRQRLGHWNER